VFGYTLGSFENVAARFRCVRLALTAIAPAYRGYKTTLHIITDVGFNNVLDGIDEETYKWFNYYKDITMCSISLRGTTVTVEEDNIISRVRSAARDALKAQENYDSGTVDGPLC
jgi:hypothetical protein